MSYDIKEHFNELSEEEKRIILFGHYMLNLGFPELSEKIIQDDELFQKIIKVKIKTYSLKILDEIIKEINEKIIEVSSKCNKNEKKLIERYNEGLEEATSICLHYLL